MFPGCLKIRFSEIGTLLAKNYIFQWIYFDSVQIFFGYLWYAENDL